MRGFSAKPALPSYEEVYGLRAAAIAVYPMYKGLARLVGMDLVGKAQTLAEQIDVLESNGRTTISSSCTSNTPTAPAKTATSPAKVKRIEEFDAIMPRIMALKPTVLIVTGDHSTPAKMKSHSWHPVPTLIAGQNVRTDACQAFGESECLRGGLGQFEAKYLMPLLLRTRAGWASLGLRRSLHQPALSQSAWSSTSPPSP